MMASEWAGDANMVHPLDLASQWKPILVYSKGPWVKRGRWYDVSRVNSKEKDCHEWQQPLEEVETLGSLLLSALGIWSSILAAAASPRRLPAAILVVGASVATSI